MMVSKRFILLVVTFASVLLITSKVANAREFSSNYQGEVEGIKYDVDARKPYVHGPRGYYHGPGGYYHGGPGGYYHRGPGGYYHGGFNNGWRYGGEMGEETSYRQDQEAQTNN